MIFFSSSFFSETVLEPFDVDHAKTIIRI